MNAYRYTELVNSPQRRREERLDTAQTAAKVVILVPLGLALIPVILFLQAVVLIVECGQVVVEVCKVGKPISEIGSNDGH